MENFKTEIKKHCKLFYNCSQAILSGILKEHFYAKLKNRVFWQFASIIVA
jgi:hypothetical protein